MLSEKDPQGPKRLTAQSLYSIISRQNYQFLRLGLQTSALSRTSVAGQVIYIGRFSGLGLRPSGFRLRSSSYDGTRRPHTQGSTLRVEKNETARIKEVSGFGCQEGELQNPEP